MSQEDPDQELEAMAAVHSALEPLEGASRSRVLAWANARYPEGAVPALSSVAGPPNATATDTLTFGSLGDLFYAAEPENGLEQALVAAYWFQVVSEQPDFGGGEVNDALKHLGHGLTNVTRTLEQLRSKKPSLIMQVAKTGRSRQGRKRYKLTEAGANEVRTMLQRKRGEA